MTDNYNILREQMVAGQLRSRGIKDAKVLEAFSNVPREEFVPEQARNFAYSDRPLSIGSGQTISQPYMVALMSQALGVSEGGKILEVGTGSGYQAAILAQMGADIYSIERHPDLAVRAENNLKKLGYSVRIKVGDGSLGWEEESPFSGIIVTAGAFKVPRPLTEQLERAGKLVIPVGGSFSQVLTKITKIDSARYREERICGCVFVPLKGEHGWRE